MGNLAAGVSTTTVLSLASFGVALIAVVISLVSLYSSNLAPFKIVTAAGDLRMRIYPIKNGDQSWYMASADIPIQSVNIGARVGRVLLYRLRASYPSLPISEAYEIFDAAFIVDSKSFMSSGPERFDWLSSAVLNDWHPFSVLPKEAVDRHVVFETRWDNPVVSNLTRFTLQLRRDGHEGWIDVASWEVDMNTEMFADLARGSSYTATPIGDIPDDSTPQIYPADLYNYLKPDGPLPGPDPQDKGSRLVYLNEEHGNSAKWLIRLWRRLLQR
jgi:hypothetical protein